MSDKSFRDVFRRPFRLPPQARVPPHVLPSGVVFKRDVTDDLAMNDERMSVLEKLLPESQDPIVDNFFKLLVKRIAEEQDPITDTESLLRTLLFQDTQEVSDTFARTLFKLLSDTEEVSDVEFKVLLKLLSDRSEVSDQFSKILAKLSAERQEISDDSLESVIRTSLVQDTEEISDALFKTLIKILSDTQEGSDTLIKELRKLLMESQDPIFDQAASVARILLRRVLEDQPVRDAFALALFKTLTDEQSGEDVIVKELRKLVAEDQDPIVDTVATQKIVAAIIREILEVQDVRDTFSLTLSKILTEDQRLADNVAKLIANLIIDSHELSDTNAAVKQLQRRLTETQDVFDAGEDERICN